MKVRKTKDLQRVLLSKGFEERPVKKHHVFYVLHANGKKQAVSTYLSHGNQDYDKKLMGLIRKQLKFPDNQKLDDFFDCPLSKEQYVEMLIEIGEIEREDS
jgi:predicted RNA binding protein YcfA (HicA-like mRNA interferase family)